MFCLCVKKSNKKRQFHKENLAFLPSELSESLSTSNSRGCIQNLLEPATKPTRQHARLLRLRRLHATRRPETHHARRSGAAQPADDLSSPSPSHTPPVEPLHHSNGSHRPGSNFRRHFVPEYPLLQLLGCLDSMHRLDIRISCSNADFGRNIKRWSHSDRAFPSTSRRHFGGRGETFFSTLEKFSEL